MNCRRSSLTRRESKGFFRASNLALKTRRLVFRTCQTSIPSLRFALVLGLAVAGGGCRCPAPRATDPQPTVKAVKYQYELQAIVKVDGAIVQLPKPMYFTDFYMGAWDAYDLSQYPDLDLGTKLFYVPNQQPGPYYIGPYSSENFGDPATVRRRLRIIKDAGLYPAHAYDCDLDLRSAISE